MNASTPATPPRSLALVTGASSGIGLALAQALAARGHDLILVARDEKTLTSIASDLRKTYSTSVSVIVQDLSVAHAADKLFSVLQREGRAVDILVNNAGFGVHGVFAETAAVDELRMIRLQLDVLVELTKHCLVSMRTKRQGRILNVASVYSFAPVPYQAVYGACKAFMYSFSEALGDELRNEGVTVTVLAPGSTRTAFRSRAGVKEKRPGGSGLSAEIVAEAAVAGLLRGQRLVVPGIWNRIFVLVSGLLPRLWIAPILRHINGVRGLAEPPSRR